MATTKRFANIPPILNLNLDFFDSSQNNILKVNSR